MRRLTVIVLSVAFLAVPLARAAEAKRDPNCYIDLNAVLNPSPRSGVYVMLGATGVGAGIAISGGRKKKGRLVAGLILAGAGAAGAIYFAREYTRYKNAETCGLDLGR